MQAWSDEGEAIFVSVESTDEFDSSTLAVDFFRRGVQNTRGVECTKYCAEKRHTTHRAEICTRKDRKDSKHGTQSRGGTIRGTCHKSKAYAALISNIGERDRAKDAEQHDVILRTVIKETSKFDNRIGKIRDDEKMLSQELLMHVSLLNFRFHGAILKYEDVGIASENIMDDKVSTVPTSRQKKADTSVPMEIGIAAKDDSEGSNNEGDQQIIDIALQAVYKGPGNGNWGSGKGPSWNTQRFAGGKGGKDANREGKSPWQQGGEETDKGGKGGSGTCWTCGNTGHIAALCLRAATRTCAPLVMTKNEVIEKALDSEEELGARCLLEESKQMQCQEVISKKDKQQLKKRRSCVTAECGKQSTLELPGNS